jgi:hypothetical protein
MSPKTHAACAVVAGVVVVTAIAWGFHVVGSPSTRRLERLDEQRLQDLQTIAREIRTLVVDPEHQDKLWGVLPKSLEEAAQQAINARLSVRDPETGKPYRYTVKSASTFELCAEFSFPRDWDAAVFWNHPAGEHCFTVDVLAPAAY